MTKKYKETKLSNEPDWCPSIPLAFLVLPLFDYRYRMIDINGIKTKPLFGKPTIRFLERQLDRLDNVQAKRMLEAPEELLIEDQEHKFRYSDIEAKEKTLLRMLSRMYEQKGEREDAKKYRDRLRYLEELR